MGARTTVKFKLDLKNPPPLTAAQRKRLAAVAALPDAQIDYGDIPRQTDRTKWIRSGVAKTPVKSGLR